MPAEDSIPEVERWLPVVGWEGLYEVSDLGRVRRLGHAPLKWATNHKAKYATVSLSRPLNQGYQAWRVQVHRLVMEAFVGPRPAGLQCRHLNGIPTDNRLDNLRWGTASENQHDRRRHGTDLRGEQIAVHKLTADQARVIYRLSTRRRINMNAIANFFPVTRVVVNLIARGRSWAHATADLRAHEMKPTKVPHRQPG